VGGEGRGRGARLRGLARLRIAARKAIRFGVGVASGVVFGSAAGLKIADELSLPASIGDAELMLMGSAAASFVAWWALGFVIRSLQRGSLTDFWKG
jgi:undecaprenyl pyrophosphate phosphatase UppP